MGRAVIRKDDDCYWHSYSEPKDCEVKRYLHLPNNEMVMKGKGKVVPVLNQAPHHEDILGEWKYSSTHYRTRH
jgi:hypothetical protein